MKAKWLTDFDAATACEKVLLNPIRTLSITNNLKNIQIQFAMKIKRW